MTSPRQCSRNKPLKHKVTPVKGGRGRTNLCFHGEFPCQECESIIFLFILFFCFFHFVVTHKRVTRATRFSSCGDLVRNRAKHHDDR